MFCEKVDSSACNSNSSLDTIILHYMKVNVPQLCLTVCDPMDYTVHGIVQAGILEWVAFPCSKGSSQHRDQTQVSLIAGEL